MGKMDDIWAMQRLLEPNYDSPNLLRVEELLMRWGEDQVGYRIVDGYAGVDSSCQDHTSSMQFHDSTDVVESRTRIYLVQQVDACVRDLPMIEEALLRAVYANAVGERGWMVGPLKAYTRDGLLALHRKAVLTLLPMLRRRGVGIE